MFTPRIFHKEEAFTLIEILLVITIIGILSGAAAVGMSMAADSARIAKAKNFAHSIEEHLGPSNKGKWNFNTVESGIVQDFSGQGNDAVLEGNASSTSDTPMGTGAGEKAIVFDGDNDDINAGDEDSLKPTEGLTISLWFKPFEYNQYSSYSAFISSKSYASVPYKGYVLGLYFDGRVAGYVSDSDSGLAIFSSQTAELNKWHHAALTLSGGVARIYLDGRKGEEKPYTGPITYDEVNVNEVWMGDDHISNKDFKGIIDNVQVYADAFESL